MFVNWFKEVVRVFSIAVFSAVLATVDVLPHFWNVVSQPCHNGGLRQSKLSRRAHDLTVH